MIIGNKEFLDSGRTYVMGILNVTPDSFSDGGKYNSIERALKHAEDMVNEGAHIIDIGGESTRPGYELVGDEEEIRRIVPVIEAVKKEFDVPVSVDTYHSHVAKAAIDAGADLINDIWGLVYPENDVPMSEIVSKGKVSVCIMHNSARLYEADAADKQGIGNNNDEIIAELDKCIRLAESAGIAKNRIMVDPGVGFAKDYNMNMSMIANVEKFKKWGYPVLLGTSGKSAIGLTLNVPISERLEGTLATTAYAVLMGCSYVRVHHVKENLKVINMMEGILKYKI